MSICHRLAAYVQRASWDRISPEAKGKLKQHVLDSLGCALGAIPDDNMAAIRSEAKSVPEAGPCSLIGGGTATPERASFYNGALVRCLSFTDVFLAPGEICHPADNLAALLAGAEMVGASGEDFLLALAIAYHIQCRLTDSGVPIQRNGFNETLTLSISLAAGLSKVLALSENQTANAIALCAAECISLQSGGSARAGSQWNNLAAASVASRCLQSVRLARAGVDGPSNIFEEPSGLEDTLGKKFGIDWDRESFDGILACSLLKFNSDAYAQSCLEALLALRAEHHIRPEDVQGVHVDLFKAGYDLLRSSKSHQTVPITTRHEAVRSLPYLLAAALFDGELFPEQFEGARLESTEIRSLAQRTECWLSLAYTREFPEKLRCKVRVGTKDGQIFEAENESFEGFFRTPMSVDTLLLKFKRLGSRALSDNQLQLIIECVAKLEHLPAADLARALQPGRTAIGTTTLEPQAVTA